MSNPIPVLASLLAVLLILPSAALPDVKDGIAAFDRQDYAEAYRQFSDPALAHDIGALSGLSWMAFKGLGQPRDLVTAYALLMIRDMFNPKGPDSAILYDRVRVSALMTADQIKAAEAMVVARLKAELGEDVFAQALKQALSGLRDCRHDCIDEARRVAQLGPAAHKAIPWLEELMITDPKWVPREHYTFALFSIGTKAIPAFCRMAENRMERQREGTFNALLAAQALGAMGAAASDGRDCLLRTMQALNSDVPEEQKEISRRKDGDENALLFQTERVIAMALVNIGDPARTSAATAQAIYRAEPSGEKGRLMAYVLGMTYEDFDPMLEQAPAGLSAPDAKSVDETLRMLTDLFRFPEFA